MANLPENLTDETARKHRDLNVFIPIHPVVAPVDTLESLLGPDAPDCAVALPPPPPLPLLLFELEDAAELPPEPNAPVPLEEFELPRDWLFALALLVRLDEERWRRARRAAC